MFFKQCVAVHILLEKDNAYFFLRRARTGYMDGYFSTPAGKVDEGEDFETAALREVREEAGITVQALKLLHVLHRFDDNAAETKYWIDLYFKAEGWDGVPFNAEPEKASEVCWLDKAKLGLFPVQPSVAHALERIECGDLYSMFGWSHDKKIQSII